MTWPVRRIFTAAVGVLAVGTLLGLIALWPNGSSNAKIDNSLRPPTVLASVIAVKRADCAMAGPQRCVEVEAQVTSGPRKGLRGTFTSGDVASDPSFSVGDHLRMAVYDSPKGVPDDGPALTFVDFDRRGPMLLLVLLFVAVVLVAGRLRGALSLIGLGASIAIVVLFIVPAILDGRSPLAVAMVGSLAVMFFTICITHGFGVKSIAAILGTSASLAITAALAVGFTGLANITGFSSEEATILQTAGGDISVSGLVLAGMVIAALGVLDDLTVSQASAVLALRRANAGLKFGDLYRSAIEVGRDHVAATVNTLVLAYVGASLPVLLIFSVGGTAFADAINYEAVAAQIVGTMVGSIGLISAVPLTTAAAAALAMSVRPSEIRAEDAHAH